jgi:type II secretory pathway component PulF
VAGDVAGGEDLSLAFSNRPEIFGRLLPAVTKAGETAGVLPELLRLAATHMMAEDRLRRRLGGALVYPAFVVAAVAIALVLFSVHVLPTFARVFEETEHPLPGVTKAVLSFGSLLGHHWPALIGAGIVVVVLTQLLKRKYRLWDSMRGRYLLRLPFWGRIERNVAMAQLTRTLGTLVSARVPLVRAVELSADVVKNPEIRRQFLEIRVPLVSGGDLSDLLAGMPDVDPFVTETVDTGQNTGNMGSLLLQAAQFYEAEVEIGLQTLTALLEPVIIVFVAAMVTIVAFAMYLPLFDLVQTARVG